MAGTLTERQRAVGAGSGRHEVVEQAVQLGRAELIFEPLQQCFSCRQKTFVGLAQPRIVTAVLLRAGASGIGRRSRS